MSNAREQIFANIRRGLGRGPLEGDALDHVRQRLKAHPANCIPARSALAFNEQVNLFKEMALEAAAELHELDRLEALPAKVAELLPELGGGPLVMASEPELTALAWPEELPREERVARAGDHVSLTGAFAGIAETGTLMLLSGAQSPTTLNFLPDTHLVVLRRSAIVGPYEAAWQKVRELGGTWPRTVNMITGPSRSADIEQKLQMGAHGPKRLIIFLLND
ncbi:LUD domain-containing protein [Motiliproteus sp. SC1-56]|uniref:LutC/YkgG family protein n=1 Tax=Motiliproteus sp. SC1-56 TaxID=2799565 RepID=UPI001A8C4BA9|nr:LUD domain-containing protein [Motiliproteus sp. SC1-56]